MDSFDAFTTESSTAKAHDLSELKNAHETAHDGFSWVIEDHPTTPDQIPSSEEPTASNDDQLETGEQLQTLPPTTAFNDDQFDTHEQLQTLPPTTSNDDQFETGEQFHTSPPAASNYDQFETVEQSYAEAPSTENSTANYYSYEAQEDKTSFDIFSTEAFSPLQAVLKKREEEIAAKDAEENRKIAILREQAKTDLENWYNERQRQMEQKFRRNKTEETDSNKKTLEKSSKQTCDWSKVIRLIDLTDGKQSTRSKRDLTRMKESIFNAKRIADKEKLANGN